MPPAKKFTDYKQKSEKHFYTLIVILALSFVSIIISGTELFIENDTIHEKEVLRKALYSNASSITQQIQQSIASGISATESLHALLLASNFNVAHFNVWAGGIIGANPNISAVQLAPNGIVQHIFPLENHKNAIGHDLLSDKRRDDSALKTIKERTLTFVGPIELIQNGKLAVIGRLPVFKESGNEEKFWGFTIVLIYIEQIIPVELLSLEEVGIQYQLEGFDPDLPDKVVFAKSPAYEQHEDDIVVPVNVPNGTWTLHLCNNTAVNRWYLPLRIACATLSIFIAFFISIQQIRMRRKTIDIIRLNKKLEELSFRDELTSLDNRRSAHNMLANLVSQAKRYNESLCLTLMDLDHFKEVNDCFGHPAGDACLRHVSTVIKAMVRDSDIVARLGGDEFVCIFPRTDLDSARVIVEKIRQQLANSPLYFEGQEISQTLSFGIAELRKGKGAHELIAAADKQLYRAKKAGRNRVASESDCS